MDSVTDLRRLPAGIARAIVMLTLALGAAGAVKADALAASNAWAARAAVPPVAVGQHSAVDGGSKDDATPDCGPVDGVSDVVPVFALRAAEERLHAVRDGAVPR
jgi:hypothetical protein